MNPQNQPAKKNVFISYRVSDTAGETGRLVDALKSHFEEDQIFMDIDKIEPGVDFTEVISRSLDICEVMLAIIGPKWQGTDANGQSRIKKGDDWVRLELSTALKRNIRVVPILVDGASLPDVSDLPDDLEALTRRQSYELSNKRWRYDTEQLMGFLQHNIGVKPKRRINPPPPPPPEVRPAGKPGMNIWLKVVLGIFAFIGVLGVIGLIIGEEKPQPQNVTGTTTNTVPPVNNQEVVSQMDVTGNWVDPEGGIIRLQQSGNKLNITVFHNNEQTGSGSGYIEGRNVEMSINMLNVAMVTLNVQLSDDGNKMSGNLTATAEGNTNTIRTELNRTNQ